LWGGRALPGPAGEALHRTPVEFRRWLRVETAEVVKG